MKNNMHQIDIPRDIIWTSKKLTKALSIEVPEGLETGVLQFNSQHVCPGDLFIALGNSDRDGHKYVADAISRGASAAIVSKDLKDVDANKLIKVSDTNSALGLLAEFKRMNSNAKFIAITGSVGKTTTKDAMRLVMSEFGKCFAGRGNFNNYLGVPINLASMPDDIDYAILEIGMNAKGEIDALTKQVLPHFAIITTIAENHIEFFGSVEKIAEAKCEILRGLDINEGVAIIPRDVDTYNICIQNVDSLGLQNVCTIGVSDDANVKFVSYELMEGNLVRLKYEICESEVEFIMHFIPQHIARNFVCCFAVADQLGLEINRVIAALSNYIPGSGRGKIISTISDSGKNFTIIADYYNSSPTSLKASLKNISLLDAEKKVLVIGDMGELGEEARRMHAEIAEYINDSGAQRVFLIGELVKEMISGLRSDIEYTSYDSTDEFLHDIDKNFEGNEMVLIKGSFFMHLDKVAKQLGVQDDI